MDRFQIIGLVGRDDGSVYAEVRPAYQYNEGMVEIFGGINWAWKNYRFYPRNKVATTHAGAAELFIEDRRKYIKDARRQIAIFEAQIQTVEEGRIELPCEIVPEEA